MLVISSRISGWRVTDSITLPKMIPIPTPAPTAPRPPPTPIPNPLVSPDEAAANERTCESTELSSFSLVRTHSAADIDGAERRKDERLQRGYQAELEQVHEHREGHREPAEERQSQDHRQATGHEQDDHVPGQDVGE